MTATVARAERVRGDAVAKATGNFAFAGDLRAPGMLHGVTVRSTHVHARIVAVDVAAALALPGVHAVLTASDVPGAKRFGLKVADQPVLADDVVRHHGEAVALVAAERPDQARRAAAAVRVRYEPLEAVTDARAAGAPALRTLVIRHGDPAARGDVRVSGVYDVARQDPAFLAAEAGLAIPDGEGGVDLHAATQWLHGDRDQIAPCLALPPEMVRVHLAGVGGAFGGREDLSMQIHAALLALRTGRAVRMVYDRGESFAGHVHRHPARIEIEHEATRDGDLVRVTARAMVDAGAYTSKSAAVIGNLCAHLCGPYRVPSALLEGVAVLTNNPPCGAMRGFGVVQACVAHEAQMDRLAAALGCDPAELRLRNALRPGDPLPTGGRVEGTLPVAEVIRRCAALAPPPDDRPRPPHVRRGTGLAVGMKNLGYSAGVDDATAARVRLHGDAAGDLVAEVHCAAAEVGQGVTEVILRTVREALPRADRVVLAPPSTATVGSAGSASASRLTWMTCGALRLACGAVREELAARGGVLAPGEEIDLERTYRQVRTDPLDPETGQVAGERAYAAFACAAMRAVVDVDVELGTARVVWLGTAQDVGRTLDRTAVEGQIEGGAAQGVGLALMEELQVRDGVVAAHGFDDYLIPTACDVPPVVAIDLVEQPDPRSPGGVKGVGEPPTVVATAAVLAALRDATGLELPHAPARLGDLAPSR